MAEVAMEIDTPVPTLPTCTVCREPDIKLETHIIVVNGHPFPPQNLCLSCTNKFKNSNLIK